MPQWRSCARSPWCAVSASFVGPNHLEVELTEGDSQQKTGQKQLVRFASAIIAAGSAAVRLPFLPDDPRIVDSTGALELRQVPKRMLVIGGGIIGLEMATVYSTLGARVDVVEMLDGLMTGTDRDLVRVWQKFNAKPLRQGDAEDEDGRGRGHPKAALKVRFEGEAAPRTRRPTT